MTNHIEECNNELEVLYDECLANVEHCPLCGHVYGFDDYFYGYCQGCGNELEHSSKCKDCFGASMNDCEECEWKDE